MTTQPFPNGKQQEILRELFKNLDNETLTKQTILS